MISVNDFKTGMTIELNGNIYQVVEFQHVKPGKGAAFVRSKLKDLRAGITIDHTFNAGVKVKKAHIDKKTMSYLYDEGETLAMMDMNTYDQISVPKASLGKKMGYLKENFECTVMMYESEIIGIEIPLKVELEITDADPGVAGNTAGNATKKATLETGLVMDVPLFVEPGDVIIVNTDSGEYISRKK